MANLEQLQLKHYSGLGLEICNPKYNPARIVITKVGENEGTEPTIF
jgi:hypothetical protein